jgi:hypothetical protein
MLRTAWNPEASFRFTMNQRHFLAPLLLATFTSVCFAQLIPDPVDCRISSNQITYPTVPLTYPMTSDRYAVQYRLGFGDWTDARVYISYYGGTNASPNHSTSGYSTRTSMSFVSIPARALMRVELRVTKLFDSGFQASDHVSVRPSVKLIGVNLASNDTVQLSTITGRDFAGEQFLLWWGDDKRGGAVEALAFFLDQPYNRPTGGNVKTVTGPADLTGDLSSYDTLDFEGTVAIGNGAQAFLVPRYINNIYLAPGAWVQGKLRFKQSGNGNLRRVYGPGVLDGSRFEYDLRACDDASMYPEQGYHALSWDDRTVPDRFLLDGIVITDHNHATADLLINGVVNNVKSIGWNGLNGGFRLGDNTTVSNVFLRSGDDSLMMWGASVTVTNATVWQNYNGGVVNLGWGDKSPGDDGLIDGLYVVKTDWNSPTDPSWTAPKLNGQNNAVIASLMVPGTMFGYVKPSLYRNIVVEDPPRTLLSLKIVFPECDDPSGPREGNCENVTLTSPSVLNLNIENLLTPPSIVENSIGFQTLPSGFPNAGYTLQGRMNISLTNVFVKSPAGAYSLLKGADTTIVGKVVTNGDNIGVSYDFRAGRYSLVPLFELAR